MLSRNKSNENRKIKLNFWFEFETQPDKLTFILGFTRIKGLFIFHLFFINIFVETLKKRKNVTKNARGYGPKKTIKRG